MASRQTEQSKQSTLPNHEPLLSLPKIHKTRQDKTRHPHLNPAPPLPFNLHHSEPPSCPAAAADTPTKSAPHQTPNLNSTLLTKIPSPPKDPSNPPPKPPGGSNRATHGSQTSGQSRGKSGSGDNRGASSGGGRGEAWALQQWLEQGPGDEPWRAGSRRA